MDEKLNSMYLIHHGILGQKWGVRNGPPYPIEKKGMDKGTRLNSVSPIGNNKRYLNIAKSRSNAVYTYNPNDPHDVDVYKGAFSMFLRRYRGAMFVFEHEYETVKDLKMPTSKERIDEFIDLYKNSKIASKELGNIQNILIQQNVKSGKYKDWNVDLNNLKTKEDYEKAYAIFNHAMENVSRQKITKDYMKRMQKKYDAMVDDNNQGVYNEAHDPIIVFNPKKNLKPINTKLVSDSEIVERTDRLSDTLAKKGKRVML